MFGFLEISYLGNELFPLIKFSRRKATTKHATKKNWKIKIWIYVWKITDLIDGIVQPNFHSVDDVDSVGLRVGDDVLHEAAKAGQVAGDRRDAHHGALGRSVAPIWKFYFLFDQIF